MIIQGRFHISYQWKKDGRITSAIRQEDPFEDLQKFALTTILDTLSNNTMSLLITMSTFPIIKTFSLSLFDAFHFSSMRR